jgi:glutamate transport system substrate-binding protein
MRIIAMALGLVVALAATGCGPGGSSSVAGKSSLVVGVKADQPGLGLEDAHGNFAGFDVDVAKYVAGKLGASQVTFKAITSAQRESWLQQGLVDMVIATYSITPQRETLVTFAGPYYVAHQDTLVTTAETDIHTVHDLAGRRICSVPGSASAQRITVALGIPAVPVPAASYSDCISKLAAGSLDAVSTDDLILAGFAASRKGAMVPLNAPLSDERYGVGLHKGDIDGCEAVNRAITAMYQDGTAPRLLDKWFGSTTLQLTTAVPQFEGCS